MSSITQTHRLAVIPGDGIGNEVVVESIDEGLVVHVRRAEAAVPVTA